MIVRKLQQVLYKEKIFFFYARILAVLQASIERLGQDDTMRAQHSLSLDRRRISCTTNVQIDREGFGYFCIVVRFRGLADRRG